MKIKGYDYSFINGQTYEGRGILQREAGKHRRRMRREARERFGR